MYTLILFFDTYNDAQNSWPTAASFTSDTIIKKPQARKRVQGLKMFDFFFSTRLTTNDCA